MKLCPFISVVFGISGLHVPCGLHLTLKQIMRRASGRLRMRRIASLNFPSSKIEQEQPSCITRFGISLRLSISRAEQNTRDIHLRDAHRYWRTRITDLTLLHCCEYRVCQLTLIDATKGLDITKYSQGYHFKAPSARRNNISGPLHLVFPKAT